jgi:hypothetical protein
MMGIPKEAEGVFSEHRLRKDRITLSWSPRSHRGKALEGGFIIL